MYHRLRNKRCKAYPEKDLPHVAGYQPGSDETAGSSHDSIEDRRRLIPRAVRCEGLLEMEDGSQYSTGKMGDEDLVDSDEGPSLQKNAGKSLSRGSLHTSS